MIRATCLAALAAVSLTACHFLAAPAVLGASTALGITSGVVSVAKDVLELDVSLRNLAGDIVPPK